ncbi:unnamed protein product [Gongylonema pulchrum]|uniref:Uncharacterized protein n=1 Tax=Gongylonema pulchrum TaxID=637853 RepID=A0A183CVL7_9BILA|nr:unnamed protein product [Gongylonema pulchrum]
MSSSCCSCCCLSSCPFCSYSPSCSFPPYSVRNARVDFENRLLLVSGPGAAAPLSVSIGCAVSGEVRVRQCTSEHNFLALRLDDGVELRVTYDGNDDDDDDDDLYEKYQITWHGTDEYLYMKDVVHCDSGGLWYGGPELAHQKWPIASNSYLLAPYLPLDALKVCAVVP